MKTCCVTKTGYSLITCPVCCKNKKKCPCVGSLDAALPPIVSVSECQKTPEILEDGSYKYTVSIKPICSSSRNHLHTNIFLAINICNEMFVSKCFSLLARKFQSKAKKLIKDESIVPKKRGRPLNSVNKEHKEKIMKLDNVIPSTNVQINPIYFNYPAAQYQYYPEKDQYDNNTFSSTDSLSEISDEAFNSEIETNNDFFEQSNFNDKFDQFFSSYDVEKENNFFDNGLSFINDDFILNAEL